MDDATKTVGLVHMQVANASQTFQDLAKRGIESLKRGATEEIEKVFDEIVAASQKLHSISAATSQMHESLKSAQADQSSNRPSQEHPDESQASH